MTPEDVPADYEQSPRSFDVRIGPFDDHVRVTVERGDEVGDAEWAAYSYGVERTLKQWGAATPDEYPGAIPVPTDLDLSEGDDIPWVEAPGRLEVDEERPEDALPLVVRQSLTLATPGESDYLDSDHELPVYEVETGEGRRLYASVDAEAVLDEAGAYPTTGERRDEFREGQDRLIEVAETVGADDPSPAVDADRRATLRDVRERLLDGDATAAEEYANEVQSAADAMFGEGWGSVTAAVVRELEEGDEPRGDPGREP